MCFISAARGRTSEKIVPGILDRSFPVKRSGTYEARPLHFRCYTFCVRQLIVNADVFGLTAGVNRAIIETHIGGVVSAATLMANGAAFEDAVTTARSAPNLSVGCHVVLVSGTPV